MRRGLVAGLSTFIVSMLVAGCLSTPTVPNDQVDDLVEDVKSLLLYKDGRAEMDVPVQVILIGFPDEAAATLRERVKPQLVDYPVSDLNAVFPPDPEGGVEGNQPLGGKSHPLPIKPTAQFTILQAPDAVDAAVVAELPALKLEGDLPTYDAVKFEQFLAQALAAEGVRLDARTPSLAILNLDVFKVEPHTWRINLPHGHMAKTTAFGENSPLLIWDTSATNDTAPSVSQQATGRAPPRYGDRIDVTTDAGLKKVENGIWTATQIRLLHGSIYPIALEECHAITLIYAHRPTNLSGKLGLPDGAELLAVDELRNAFGNLTGGTVHVDAKVLSLPVDDPALDAIARGEFATMEVLRAWITLNWEKYWVAHEGCEPYVSFVMAGDVASVPTGILGIGTYDKDTYRISMSWVHEGVRWIRDADGPSPATPLGDETGPYNWVNFLFGHEVGHTMGMHHTFHGFDNKGNVVENHLFEDVWSVMGYSLDGRLIDFSVVDRNDFQRGRLAYLLATADQAGLQGTPAWTTSVDSAEHFDWDTAGEAMWTALEETHPEARHAGITFEGFQLATHPH